MDSDLKVYQDSKRFAVWIYCLTNNFPTNEKYGMTSQIRRAAVSIPVNLAEGSSRATDKDYKHFVNMARGSCCELKVLTEIALELKYIDEINKKFIDESINGIGKMLWGLEKSFNIKVE